MQIEGSMTVGKAKIVEQLAGASLLLPAPPTPADSST
jgi:hypothetical protein